MPRTPGVNPAVNSPNVPTPADSALPLDDDAEDARLVRAHLGGDRGATAALVTRHQDRVYAMCFRMMRDPEQASDLAQDAFVKLLRVLGQFDHRSKFTTWMTRVVMNVCFSKMRSEKLRRHASLDATAHSGDGGDEDGPGRGADLEQAREQAPDLGVERLEGLALVSAALRELEPDQRGVLILADQHGMGYEQIAEVMGVAVGTVKSRVFRARAALKSKVERMMEEAREARKGGRRT